MQILHSVKIFLLSKYELSNHTALFYYVRVYTMDAHYTSTIMRGTCTACCDLLCHIRIKVCYYSHFYPCVENTVRIA